MNATSTRLVVVSNRLPYVFERGEAGAWNARPGSGGLVTALLPVLRNRGGVWIGWPGTTEADAEVDLAAEKASGSAGYVLKTVSLTPQEVNNFYLGFANKVIWPLFHDLQSLCDFDPVYWRSYREVNAKYAARIAEHGAQDGFIWVHDYHLMNVGAELRALGVQARVGFFLHIPFPPLDLFVKLPWRMALLHALLQYDVIGFQTLRDRRNFVQCLRILVPEARVRGHGQVLTTRYGGREVRLGAFPISIDYGAFVRQASQPEIKRLAAQLHEKLPNRKLVLGVDRLDYTKGIAHRLKAFRSALERYPELRERISLIQVVVPSRVDIADYHDLKLEIEQVVGQINGEFVRPGGWVPVWYVYGSLSRNDLLAYYRAADIALITPLKDGMNLVAKEYCACSIEEDCVLILSEFAGAAAQLNRGAILVNPYDIDGVGDALFRAWNMSAEERELRMRGLRRSVRTFDVFWWVNSFLNAAIAHDLSAFPAPAEGVAPEVAADFLPI
jgi:trehalose 6-phosphate synthase